MPPAIPFAFVAVGLSRTQWAFGNLPMLLHPAPEDVLVIAFGGGALSGGYYFGALHSSPFLGEGEAIWDGNPFVSVRTGPSFYFTPKLSMGVEASYANYFGLVQFLGVSLSGSYHIPIQGRGFPKNTGHRFSPCSSPPNRWAKAPASACR